MPSPISDVAAQLRNMRNQGDPVSEASQEVLPYTRRIGDALGALRAIVTDNTPTTQLDSDLQVVHGIVAALVNPDQADVLLLKLPTIREFIATDVASAFEAAPQVVAPRSGILEDEPGAADEATDALRQDAADGRREKRFK